MQTECCECDRYAVRYHGRAAYCKSHLETAQAERPTDHECVRCHTEQPGHVHWERKLPCGACNRRDKELR